MLRKGSHIAIIFLLLVSTNGITIYHHYCGNRLISTSIITEPDNCCDAHCKACHNDFKRFRVKDRFEVSRLKVDFKQYLTNPITFQIYPVSLYSSEDFSFVNPVQSVNIRPGFIRPLLTGNQEALLEVFLI